MNVKEKDIVFEGNKWIGPNGIYVTRYGTYISGLGSMPAYILYDHGTKCKHFKHDEIPNMIVYINTEHKFRGYTL